MMKLVNVVDVVFGGARDISSRLCDNVSSRDSSFIKLFELKWKSKRHFFETYIELAVSYLNGWNALHEYGSAWYFIRDLRN